MITDDIKVIQTEQQYRTYLKEVHSLMLKMPKLGTLESDRLELLTVLIEAYENTKYPVELPDPIDAILFRMQEKGLRQADLVPYFGTRSRVSEILSRKRPLTVTMIRALAIGLGISAETLIGLYAPKESQVKEEIDWSKFPVKEMMVRGWIDKVKGNSSKAIENAAQRFMSGINWQLEEAAFKRNLSGEAYSPMTVNSLFCWLTRVKLLAKEKKLTLIQYKEDTLSSSFLREIAKLSWYEQGPKLAVEYLEKHGIVVIIEKHLNKTKLDGAALRDEKTPIIGLTLRHDRLDNFWFTLLHELAHLWKHIKSNEMFFDNFDSPDTSFEDQREAEANRIAREALIPRIAWKRSEACFAPSHENIDSLSRELKIHPAIIAGRIRRENENYQLFSDLIGNGEVRKLFLTYNE